MEDKKQTLAKLYALRAGMSAISLASDNLKKVEDQKFNEDEVEYPEGYDENYDKYWENVNKFNENEGEIEKIKNLQLANKEYPTVDLHNFYLWLRRICYLLLLPCLIFMPILMIKTITFIRWVPVVIFIVITVSIVVASLYLRKWPKICKQIQDSKEYELNKEVFEKRLEKLTTENERLESTIKYFTAITDELDEKYGKNIERAKKEFKKSMENQMAYCYNKANSVYAVLQKNYSEILDVRDWENVDLIIYYFETNRAESIKEALIMVDAQKAVGAIVGAINNASREISSTIRAGFAGIRNEIQTGFDGLYKQMYDNANALQNGLKNLTDSIDFANSLQEKANVSSKQLADDIAYIKQRAINKY